MRLSHSVNQHEDRKDFETVVPTTYWFQPLELNDVEIVANALTIRHLQH